jgi:ferredoxin
VADSGAVRLARSLPYDIVVVHVAPSEPDSIFIANLRALDEAGHIRLVARYDDQHGFLDVGDLDDLVPDLAERTTFACGPAGLLDALAAHHEGRGLKLLTEQFRVANLVVAEGGTVSFARTGATVEADGATPILEAAEAAGVLMPSGCRMGICYGCVLPMREGVVRDLRTGDVTTASPGETDAGGVPIQTCISAAAGPCDIDH